MIIFRNVIYNLNKRKTILNHNENRKTEIEKLDAKKCYHRKRAIEKKDEEEVFISKGITRGTLVN